VVEFVGCQAPEPRRRLRSALRALTREEGDPEPLEGPLQEYHRLRIGSHRVILRYASSNTIECVFAERRNVVYEVFAETLIDRLTGKSG
jgi:mRNA-degrading endonuclease RelE of RelBE toxin-antitoxin system